MLETAMVYDQLNVSELATFELMARRYQLWEEKYAGPMRTAETGDGAEDWLDERRLFLGQRRTTGHALVCPALESWIAERLREESAVLKERRKGREERQLARGVDVPHGDPSAGASPNAPKGTGRGGAKK